MGRGLVSFVVGGGGGGVAVVGVGVGVVSVLAGLF